MESPLGVAGVPAMLGPFHVRRVLGQGAMGIVYLGERVEPFAQRVAIKVLRPELALLGDRPALEYEEHILTSLEHPAIVRLLDRGESVAGLHFIVMEYVDGVPLDVWQATEKPGRDAAVRMLLEIAQAVEYAHRRLVIHADLKPANILVTPEGRPKLLDFGVATLVSEDGAKSSPAYYTAGYASPEQIAGGRVTPACDVYSLGIVGCLLLTGLPVFSREVSDRDLRAILKKSLRVAPEERYRTVGELSEDLRAVLDRRPVAARRGGATYRVRKWVQRHQTSAVVAAVLCLILLASAAGVAVQTARATRERATARARLAEMVRLTGVLDGELYRSTDRLAHAEGARAMLLEAARGTLDKVSDEEANDAGLAVELAGEYEQMARLDAGAGDGRSAQQDARKGLRVLAGKRVGKDGVEERERLLGLQGMRR